MENDHKFVLINVSNDSKHVLDESEYVLGRGWLSVCF